MNSSSPRHNPAIDEQAANWAARLDGDVLEASERSALDAWLAQSPAHRDALSSYCQLSADLEEQLPALVASGAIQMPAEPQAHPSASFARRWSLPRLASVTLAAAAALAIITWAVRPAPHIENVATAVAQRSSTTLADGTRVELNAHTSLRFENTRTERRVRLAGGEALFIVAKDRARPFIVETPSGSVRVTGTTFNVRNDATGTTLLEVTVVEGSVEVRPSEPPGAESQPPYSLTAGEQLSTATTGIAQRKLSASAVADALAWRDGRIVFEDTPLREVAARFARYHGRKITVDPAVADLEVGGMYGLDDLPNFLTALEAVLPVKTAPEWSGAISISSRTGS